MNLLFRCSFLIVLLIPSLTFANTAEDVARSEMRARFGDNAKLIWDASRGVPAAMIGLDLTLAGKTPTAKALRFLRTHGALFGIDAKQLGKAHQSAFHGRPVVRFQQTVDGVPVEGRYVALSFDKAHQKLLRLSSDWMPLESFDVVKTFDKAKVRAAIEERYPGSPQGKATQVVLANGPNLAKTCWRIPVALVPPVLIRNLWVDGVTGRILQDRLVGKDVPGEVVR